MARRSSYTWTLDHYGKACKGGMVKVEWYPGQSDYMLPEHALLYKALGAVMVAYRYRVRDVDTGFYNCRNITGGSRPSPHAWPIAGDVNWKTNPYTRTPTLRPIKWGVETDMPAAMVREIESITAGGVQAFRWGGRWRSVKDAMHWEVRVTPEEIAQGIEAPRGFYGDDMAQLSEEAQKFWQDVFEELGELNPATNEEFAKVLVDDYRQRKAAGAEVGRHTHPVEVKVGEA